MRNSKSWTSVVLLAVAAACGSQDPKPLTPGTTSGGTTTSTSGVSTTSVGSDGSVGTTGATTSSVGGASAGSTETSTGTLATSSDAPLQNGSTSTTTMGGSSSTTAPSSGGSSTTGAAGSSTTMAQGGRSSTSTGMGGASSTTSDATTTGGMASCDSGPLDAPLPNCSPEPVPDSGDYYADCVARINQFRWECQCLPPLERWVEAESCADQQAEYDYQQGSAHQGIQAGICSPGGNGQNECPDYGPNFGIVDFCLQQMWDEGPGQDFNAHGHYLNMSNTNFSRVACGMYVTPEGNVWAVQNFQ